MNDRDCESCKKFSRVDPLESEGYCDAKRTWVDPKEGEDCKMHEFTLHSATKYKDGTPIMSEPEKVYCDTDSALIQGESNQLDTNSSAPYQFDIYFCDEDCCPHWKTCPHTLSDKQMCPFLPHDTDSNLKYLEQTFKDFAKVQDELIEEYDATLKTHGDTLESHLEILEDHHERITNNEDNIDALSYDLEVIQENVYTMYKFLESMFPDFLEKIQKIKEHTPQFEHKCSDFCGNCAHVNKCRAEDGIYACELSGEIVDLDDSSCSMFEPPF